MKKYQILLFCIIPIFSGCFWSSTKVDVMKFQDIHSAKLTIPQICKPIYRSKGTGVAVVNFTNNSAFGMRDSRVSQSLVAITENIVKQISGFHLYSREDIDKIEAEQKFQDSGLVDDSTLVEFGEMIGVRYIITGSLDNVKINNKDYRGLGHLATFAGLHSNNRKTQIAGLLAGVVSYVASGTKVEVTLSVKMLDVQTGKILFSQTISDDVSVGTGSKISNNAMVGVIKSVAIKAMPQIKEPISKMARLQGYLTKIKFDGEEYIGQINLGIIDGLEDGDEFELYDVGENIDPLNGNRSCEVLNTPIKLTISNQIGESYSWGVLEGETSRAKIYQIVKRIK